MNKEKVTIIPSGEGYKVSYRLEMSDVIDTKVYDMSRSGACPQMLSCSMEEEDGTRVFEYDVKELKPLHEVIKYEMNKRQMLTIMLNLLHGLETFGRNMVSLSYVAKDVHSIFVSPDICDVRFVVAPVDKKQADIQEVRELVKSVLIDARYSENDMDNYVARLISYANTPGTFSTADMKEQVKVMLAEIGVNADEIIEMSSQPAGAERVGGNSHILRGDAGKVSRLGVMRNNAMRTGQPMPPQGMNGMPQGMYGQPMPPQGMYGQPMPPQGMYGQPMPPQGMYGQPMPPQGMSGQPMPPQGMSGQPVPPQGMYGQPMPPQGMYGQPMPPRGMSGQPVPPQGMNGQPMPLQDMNDMSLQETEDRQEKPEQNISEQEIPKENIPEQEIPKENTPEQEIPNENTPEQKELEENVSEQKEPEQKEPEQETQEDKEPDIADKAAPVPAMPPTPPAGNPFSGFRPIENSEPTPQPIPVPHPVPAPQPTPAPQPMPRPVPAPQPAPQPAAAPQQMSQPAPYLIRTKNGDRINIDKAEFKIGHKASQVDYAIKDNPAISRVHCIITKRNGVCFIKDNGSTNGTFVNGKEMEKDAEQFLTNNAAVILGDEEFIYHVR